MAPGPQQAGRVPDHGPKHGTQEKGWSKDASAHPRTDTKGSCEDLRAQEHGCRVKVDRSVKGLLNPVVSHAKGLRTQKTEHSYHQPSEGRP